MFEHLERRKVKCIICGEEFVITGGLRGNCSNCLSCYYRDAAENENLYRTWNIYKDLEKRMPGIWRDIPRYKEMLDTFESKGKYCTQCRRNLPWTEFDYNNLNPDGHKKWCRSCVEVTKRKRAAYNERQKNVRKRERNEEV